MALQLLEGGEPEVSRILEGSAAWQTTASFAKFRNLEVFDNAFISIMILIMKTRLMLLPFAVLAVCLVVSAEGIPAGGFAGAWAADFSKSKFPGPPPKIDMCTIDPDGTVTINETNSEGKSTSWHYTPEEGKPVKVVGRDNVTVTVKHVNDHTNVHIWDMNGRPAKSKSVLSRDGKVTTFTMDGTDKDGKPFHEVVVYNKQ